MIFQMEQDVIRSFSTENTVIFKPKDRVEFKLLICTIEGISGTAHCR